MQLKSDIHRNYIDDPYENNKNLREIDLRNNYSLVESLNQKEKADKDLRMKIQSGSNQLEYNKSRNKFYGVDDNLTDNVKKTSNKDQELPSSSSEFKQLESPYFKPIRYAKNNLKSLLHDPITGSFSNYPVDRPKPRPLGAKPPEVFPGKIYDSPPQVEYELPKYTKKAPRNQIFNPLTGEARTVNIETNKVYNPYISDHPQTDGPFILTEKIGKSKKQLDIPVNNPPPIFKGMGYKKSSIFS